MLQFIYFSIIFLIIPAVILSLLVVAAFLPSKTTDSDARFSGRAGFWAGLVAFAAYSISAIGGVTSPDFDVNRLPSFSWLGAIIGTILGFALPFVVEAVLPSRGIGILTLILSAASTIGLFSYMFTSGSRDFTMYLALGALFGVLMNVILHPRVARGIIRK